MGEKTTNKLIGESSPYLLQHAHNPVFWYPWREEALTLAQTQNKLLLISIGYAACHWCHVMEKESFEDPDVAQVMNTHFMNIKVDREERPDVDQIYMDALQLMTGQGGWPLNIVALPDGRPFWGATYVRKDDWIKILKQLATLYTTQPDKIEEYARDLTEGVRAVNAIVWPEKEEDLSTDQILARIEKWHSRFDDTYGGFHGAPKFPMPVILEFLLNLDYLKNTDLVKVHLERTLRQMAYGGIFDHIGGGFARYSVDHKWHVPHFEKMLYDNAQLVSLYSKTFVYFEDEHFKEVATQTIEFVEKELTHPDHGFYSSLDADSLNDKGIWEEGAYYTWHKKELKKVLGKNFDWIEAFYNINDHGHWEDGRYVLIRTGTLEETARDLDLDKDKAKAMHKASVNLLAKARETRDRPRLDDKQLTSWNALMIKALADAYAYLQDDACLDKALRCAHHIENNLFHNGSLFHSFKEGRCSIPAFLEDYAQLIAAYLRLYEVTFDRKWLDRSKELVLQCMDNFQDPKSGLFYFTPKGAQNLIRRTIEKEDNVIPSSNSVMAFNLLRLSLYFPGEVFGKTSRSVYSLLSEMLEHLGSYANWITFGLHVNEPLYEIAIVGKNYQEIAREFRKRYLPNAVLAGCAKEGSIELLKNRHVPGKTMIYVCREGTCNLPVESVSEALEMIRPSS